MNKLTEEEKKILDNFKKSIPKLNKEELYKVLIFSEALALLTDKNFKA